MKKLVTSVGSFGPFNVIETLEDRYACDGAHFQFNVVGNATIEDWTGPMPRPYVNPAIIREERNAKLAQCDWTQLADAPVNNLAWANYRQQLRDITTQTGFPWEVTWPTQP